MADCDGGEDEKRKQFGSRFLTEERNVFEHNAWDDVVWDEEQEREAQDKVAKNTTTLMGEEESTKLETCADVYWNDFYGVHQNRFFKDRHWLFTEFPELEDKSYEAAALESPARSSDVPEQRSGGVVRDAESYPGERSQRRIFEVGCGVGNTVLPVLRTNVDPGLFVYGCDLSETAVNIIRESAEYAGNRCHAFVNNVTDESQTFPFPEESLDVIILIFVLSAISPEKMQSTITRLAAYLKPGGKFMFRDYGRFDMAQLRFKNGRCIAENFYARGDGTRVYFFTLEEVKTLFTIAGLNEEQNLVDRRLQVNRGKQVKMYRVWIQAKYTKPSSSND